MAHVFMPRIFEPPVPRPVTATITGTGNSTYSYATINGTTYTAAASGIEVMAGDVISFTIMADGSKTASLTIDGEIVLSYEPFGTGTYDWTVPSGISAISITLAYSSYTGNITVTTS